MPVADCPNKIDMEKGGAEVIPECELCNLVKGNVKTHLYDKDDLVTIVDCLRCGKDHPMIVWNKHTMNLTPEEFNYMYGRIFLLFPKALIRFDQRQIKNHLHWHIIL